MVKNPTTGDNAAMQDSKDRILAAASELFLAGGARALSVRAIAQRAGVSTIGIYSHFQGKQGILDSLYIEGFEKVTAAIDVWKPGDSPRDAVLLACRNYLDTADAFSGHYQLIFGGPDPAYEPSDAAKEVGARAFATLTRLVGRLLPGSPALADKQDAAIQVWSVVHGFVGLRHHPVSQLADMRHWKQRALRALEELLDAVAAGRTAVDGRRPGTARHG